MKNKKRRGLALLAACCVMCAGVPAVAKADNVSISTNQNPTGTYSTYEKAEVLKSDTLAYDTLSGSNNVHYYKYTADKTGYFTVNLSQTSGKGVWNFAIYDADHDNQELETGSLADNYTSRIYNLAPGRTVYIKVERVRSVDVTVKDYNLTQDYQYALQVKTTQASDWEQEDNDTQAAAYTLQTGIWLNGSSYKASDEDWYVYEIPANGYFTLNFQSMNDSSGMWNVYLYDENLKVLQKESAVSSLQSGKYVLPAGSKVYIRVNGYKTGNQYRIRPDYVVSDDWETEDNSTVAKATALTAGSEMHGSINSKSDVDYYEYTATGNGYFTIRFTNADGGENQFWKLSLYDEKKNLLQTVETGDDLETTLAKMSFRKDKKVYLKVERNINDYACGHEYIVTVEQVNANNWEQESNNSMKTATVLKKNVTCKANNYSVRDKDYFVYKATKKGKVTLQVTLPESGYWQMLVYDQNKKLISDKADYDYIQSKQKFTVTLKKGQKVYVMIKARTQSSMGKTYKITAKQK